MRLVIVGRGTAALLARSMPHSITTMPNNIYDDYAYGHGGVMQGLHSGCQDSGGRPPGSRAAAAATASTQ